MRSARSQHPCLWSKRSGGDRPLRLDGEPPAPLHSTLTPQDGNTRTRRRLLQTAVLTLLLVLVGLVWLNVSQPAARCPARSTDDAARTQRILRLLRGVPEARRVLERELEAPLVCYADASEGVVDGNGVFLLPRSHGEPSNAARLGHLMLHRREALPLDDRSIRESRLPCAEFVDRVMQSERRARELEAKLRRAFSLEPAANELAELQAAYATRCVALRSGTGTHSEH
jgi:hypothetical protein